MATTTKKVLKKASSEPTVKGLPADVYEKKTIVHYTVNWDKIQSGTMIDLQTSRGRATGRIIRQSNIIFFCSNSNNYDGAHCPNKMNYRYSYQFSKGTLSSSDVKVYSLKFSSSLKVEDILMIANYATTIMPGSIKVGCKIIPNETVRKLASMLIDTPKRKTILKKKETSKVKRK